MAFSSIADKMIKRKKIQRTVWEQYLTMLHFNWLNMTLFEDLHKEVHKAHCPHGLDVLPKMIDRTIFLAGKNNKENGQNPSAQRRQAQGFVQYQE